MISAATNTIRLPHPIPPMVLSLALEAFAITPVGPPAGHPGGDKNGLVAKCSALEGRYQDQGTNKPNDDVCLYSNRYEDTSAMGYPIVLQENHTLDFRGNDTITGTDVAECYSPADGGAVSTDLVECQP